MTGRSNGSSLIKHSRTNQMEDPSGVNKTMAAQAAVLNNMLSEASDSARKANEMLGAAGISTGTG